MRCYSACDSPPTAPCRPTAQAPTRSCRPHGARPSARRSSSALRSRIRGSAPPCVMRSSTPPRSRWPKPFGHRKALPANVRWFIHAPLATWTPVHRFWPSSIGHHPLATTCCPPPAAHHPLPTPRCPPLTLPLLFGVFPQVAEMLNGVSVLSGPADALRKGEFAGIFDFADKSFEKVHRSRALAWTSAIARLRQKSRSRQPPPAPT